MEAATQSVSIQIPEGSEPGDTLEFEVQGQSLELVVPPGSQPGDVLEIEVAAAADGNTTSTCNSNTGTQGRQAGRSSDEKDGVLTINIGEGEVLEFVSQLPADHLEAAEQVSHADNTNTGGTTTDENDGTFALPWQSGIEMSQRWPAIEEALLEHYNIPPIRRILELGSGLGLVGLSFGVAIKPADHGSSHSSNEVGHRRLLADSPCIFLSDVPAAMPLINFNVKRNGCSLLSVMSTRCLRWTLERPDDDPIFSNDAPFDCILGSDLLYNIESIPPLVATMKRMLHPTRGIVLLAVRWRKPDLERAFFRDSGLDWELLPESASPPYSSRLSWQDFGDPSTEASNKFFHQTQISVNGIPTALADITEDQVKDLPSQEFRIWEQSFIQFYLGRPKKEGTVT